MTIWMYIIAGMAIVMALMGIEIKSLQSDVAKLHENEGVYKTQIKTLTDTLANKDKDIDKANKSIDSYKAASDQREKDAEKARVEAKAAGQTNRQLADQLLALQRKPGQTACDAADEIFNDYLDKRQAREQIPTTPIVTPTPAN